MSPAETPSLQRPSLAWGTVPTGVPVILSLEMPGHLNWDVSLECIVVIVSHFWCYCKGQRLPTTFWPKFIWMITRAGLLMRAGQPILLVSTIVSFNFT